MSLTVFPPKSASRAERLSTTRASGSPSQSDVHKRSSPRPRACSRPRPRCGRTCPGCCPLRAPPAPRSRTPRSQGLGHSGLCRSACRGAFVINNRNGGSDCLQRLLRLLLLLPRCCMHHRLMLLPRALPSSCTVRCSRCTSCTHIRCRTQVAHTLIPQPRCKLRCVGISLAAPAPGAPQLPAAARLPPRASAAAAPEHVGGRGRGESAASRALLSPLPSRAPFLWWHPGRHWLQLA